MDEKYSEDEAATALEAMRPQAESYLAVREIF